MNILSETGGQTCNKYFQYLYYLHEAILHDGKIRIQLPDITITDYPNLNANKWISFPFYSEYLTKVLGIKKSLKITRWFTVLFLNNYIRFFLHQASLGKISFLSGKPTWIGMDVDYSSIRHQLQYIFELRKELKAPVDALLKRDDNTIICGVHMRGGDYRKWLGGKYFFEQELYFKAMRRFLGFFQGRKVKFVMCSNEPLKEELFQNLDIINLPKATATQDIYLLQNCDYIIGTLSSFNAWASLLGNVPLFTILRSEDVGNFNLSDFSPVINYRRKANGWQFPRNSSFYFKHTHPWLYRHSNKEHLLEFTFD
ncbi:MAG: alpha-1,2-fucosyltransferase [Muribaculum sp.]|nr:alpha-1,2-fucosyltransferase [Muribaculum sp.]